MKQNLRTTHYADGSPIVMAIANLLPAYGTYCYYNNDTSNLRIYGMLYNWEAVANPSHICPKGWHVASDTEWNTMTTHLFDSFPDGAGWALKQAGTMYWDSPNVASNITGFTALPAGAATDGTGLGAYNWIGQSAFFWTSTPVIGSPEPNANYVSLDSETGSISTGELYTFWGMSCRCIKDD